MPPTKNNYIFKNSLTGSVSRLLYISDNIIDFELDLFVSLGYLDIGNVKLWGVYQKLNLENDSFYTGEVSY